MSQLLVLHKLASFLDLICVESENVHMIKARRWHGMGEVHISMNEFSFSDGFDKVSSERWVLQSIHMSEY